MCERPFEFVVRFQLIILKAMLLFVSGEPLRKVDGVVGGVGAVILRRPVIGRLSGKENVLL